MGKRSKKVIERTVQVLERGDMLIASRVDEDEAASDEAVAEQTILGEREPTEPKSIVTMIGMRPTTMNSKS